MLVQNRQDTRPTGTSPAHSTQYTVCTSRRREQFSSPGPRAVGIPERRQGYGGGAPGTIRAPAAQSPPGRPVTHSQPGTIPALEHVWSTSGARQAPGRHAVVTAHWLWRCSRPHVLIYSHSSSSGPAGLSILLLSALPGLQASSPLHSLSPSPARSGLSASPHCRTGVKLPRPPVIAHPRALPVSSSPKAT